MQPLYEEEDIFYLMLARDKKCSFIVEAITPVCFVKSSQGY